MKLSDNEVAIKKQKPVDMLHGSLIDKLLFFALPLAASSVLQQLFNSVDVAVVGHYAESQAQAAVGCNGSVINLLLNLFVGISVGANVVIASYIGQERKEKVKETVHTAMVVAIFSGIFLLALGVLIARPILTWMDTPNDVIEQAILYLRIYFLGMPFIMIYNFGAAILRSIGDTKRPLYCLIISGIVNAVLNMIFVIVFHMGVAGVGIGTVISNIISACMVVYFLTHERGIIHLSLKELRIVQPELIRILKIGVPAGLQSMVFSFANIFIQKALNGYGSDAVAGSAVALNFEYYSYFVVSAFTQATVTFTSQNFGAEQYDRCKKIFKRTLSMCMFTIGCMSIIFLLGKEFFIGLFTSKPEVAEYAATRMVYLLTLYILLPIYEIGGAALRGIGYSMMPAILTIFGTCILRLAWVYTVCKQFTDFKTLMMVYPISWGITGILVLSAYMIIRQKVFAYKS